jgi:hypothetical protein
VTQARRLSFFPDIENVPFSCFAVSYVFSRHFDHDPERVGQFCQRQTSQQGAKPLIRQSKRNGLVIDPGASRFRVNLQHESRARVQQPFPLRTAYVLGLGLIDGRLIGSILESGDATPIRPPHPPDPGGSSRRAASGGAAGAG